MAQVYNLQDHKDNTENAVMNKSLDVGNNIAFDLMDMQPQGTDNTGILFSIWTSLATQLMLRGWTAAELRKEITHYSKVAKQIKKETQQ